MASDSREELIARITAATRASQALVDAVDATISEIVGLGRTDLRCLDIVMQRGRLTAGELARAAGLTSGGATAALDRLEEAGYLRRLRDAGDRRRVLVEPTEAALRGAEELYGPVERDGHELLREYAVADLRMVLRFLEETNELQERQLARLHARLPRRAAGSTTA